jgi:hypothetical protein
MRFCLQFQMRGCSKERGKASLFGIDVIRSSLEALIAAKANENQIANEGRLFVFVLRLFPLPDRRDRSRNLEMQKNREPPSNVAWLTLDPVKPLPSHLINSPCTCPAQRIAFCLPHFTWLLLFRIGRAGSRHVRAEVSNHQESHLEE